MIAIRMMERNTAQGFHHKRYLYRGMSFEAGEAGSQVLLNGRVREQVIPSPVYPIEDHAAAAYLTGRDRFGNLNVHQPKNPALPVFVVVPAASVEELDGVLQAEMESRARRGQAAVKAEVRPMLAPIEGATKPPGDTTDGVLEVLRETNLRLAAEIAELRRSLADLADQQRVMLEATKPAAPEFVTDLLDDDGGESEDGAEPDPEPTAPEAPAPKKTTKRRAKK